MLKDCPRCYRVLQETLFEGVRVDACPGCGGVWFEAGQLAQLMRAGTGAARRLEERCRRSGLGARRAEPRCPDCRALLAPLSVPQAPGVALEGCAACRGVWVDDQELDWLAAALDRLSGGRRRGPRERTQGGGETDPG